MARFDRIGEFDPTKTYALTTTLHDRGAPSVPGDIRWRVNPDGAEYGLQGFRLALNAKGTTCTAALGMILGEGEVSKTYALEGTALWGAALTTPLSQLAGVAVVDVLDNYWGWFQVYGRCLVTDSGGTADGAKIETAASGVVTDTAGTGVIVGVAQAAITNATGYAFLTIVQPS